MSAGKKIGAIVFGVSLAAVPMSSGAAANIVVERTTIQSQTQDDAAAPCPADGSTIVCIKFISSNETWCYIETCGPG